MYFKALLKKEEFSIYPYLTRENTHLRLPQALTIAEKNQHEYLLNPKSWLYGLYSIGIMGAFGSQLWKLWRTKKAGAVDARLFGVYILAGFAWTGMGVVLEDLAMFLTQFGLLAINTGIVVLSLRYREPNPSSVQAPQK